MTDYLDVEEAIPMPGLRVVLTPGAPGSYSEAAKSILYVKKLDYIKVRQELFGSNAPLIRWTAQASAPSVIWNDERPRSTWIEQLYLFERLAPFPTLIPEDFDDRCLMFGLSNEVLGENGYLWNRRLIIVRDYTTPEQHAALRDSFVTMGQKYGYSDAAAMAAPARCAALLERFARRLHRQRARGSAYFIGNSLTALDIYWACAAIMIAPLPYEECPLLPLHRSMYTAQDPIILAAADPILLEHRDYIYRRYLQLPMEF